MQRQAQITSDRQRRNRVAWFAALASALLLVGIASAAEKPAAAPLPPKPMAVTIVPAHAYIKAPFKYAGFKLNTGTNRAVAAHEDDVNAAVFPACGSALELSVDVDAGSGDRAVKFSGQVSDYLGNVLQKFAGDISAKNGETQSKAITFQPTEQQPGPFYVTGTWNEAAGEKGELALALGEPNRRIVIEDFESIPFPEHGGPLESAPTAAHAGQSGLIVRLPAAPPVPPPANAATPAPPLVPQATKLPLNRVLKGRPVKLGVWIKSPAPVSATIFLSDPGFEAGQRKNPDTWTVGPVEVPAGDWKYVEIPMPGFGKPKSKLNPYCEGDGVIDYPLLLQWLELRGPGATQIAIDDIDLFTQGEQSDAMAVRPVSNKPIGMLYRNDKFNVAVANTWLWGAPVNVDFAAGLVDIRGTNWPIAKQSLAIAPGAEAMVPVALANLPIGPYRLSANLLAAGKPVPASDNGDEFLVYEPTGKPLDALPLRELLKDRNRLLVDLGFKQEAVIVPWHSTDNSLSVEQVMGSWTFEWIAPLLKARQDAGIEVVGVLGFCPLWADASTTYNPKMAFWYGSTYVMPARTIYWEEYVHRTVERFKDSVTTWVAWDRPDSDAFKATPEEFADRMLQVAQAAAREVNPNAKIISGPVSRENIETYIQAMAEVGATNYLDGIGVYPTIASLAPEDGFLDVILSRANRIRDREKIKAPLWVMNLGWATGDDQFRVSEADQAIYIPRAYAICRSQGIEHILLQPDRTEAAAKRDSADLIYPAAPLFGIKPASLSAKTAKAMLDGTTAVREVFIEDRREGLARAYLFARPDGKLMLAAWRREGSSVLPLPVAPESITDLFGNKVDVPVIEGSPRVTLRPDPQYILFAGVAPDALVKALQRMSAIYDDAPESAWKRGFTFMLDVGDDADEKAAHYACESGKPIAPIDSYYNNEYGKHMIDGGRHFTGSESFSVDVSAYGNADMMLRKRINYSVPDQLVKVFCDDKPVGQWFAFKRDRRYRWRDIEFVVPNSFLAGKKSVTLKFVAADNSTATSYCYWAGPLKTKTVYASDMAILVNTSGYGPEANRDKNILGGPIKFFKKPGENYAKGIGTNGAAQLPRSVVVLPLNKQYKKFKAIVGVDAATNGQGSVRFRISDGKKTIWDSQDMTYYSDPKEVDLDVSDAIILMLWVGDSDDGEKNDIANWANARLELK